MCLLIGIYPEVTPFKISSSLFEVCLTLCVHLNFNINYNAQFE